MVTELCSHLQEEESRCLPPLNPYTTATTNNNNNNNNDGVDVLYVGFVFVVCRHAMAATLSGRIAATCHTVQLCNGHGARAQYTTFGKPPARDDSTDSNKPMRSILYLQKTPAGVVVLPFVRRSVMKTSKILCNCFKVVFPRSTKHETPMMCVSLVSWVTQRYPCCKSDAHRREEGVPI